MSLPKLLFITALGLSVALGVLVYNKKSKKEPALVEVAVQAITEPVEVALEPVEVRAPLQPPPAPPLLVENPHPQAEAVKIEQSLPLEDHTEELFKRNSSKLKFVETITYKSKVNWLKGRPAWLSDYASHFETSRHFIARSLNGRPDYFKQEIAEGDKFNVYRTDVDLKFHIVVDASLCKLWLYALDGTHNEKVLIKTYQVCMGRPDDSKASGMLTPLGMFTLGDRIAIYKPKVMGYHNSKKVEMVRIFGSRWIPFEKEVAKTTAPAKGFGIHGVPWTDQGKELKQDKSSLGKYESDGCIRLSTEDMEEIFAIIITKPAVVEIVKHFHDSVLFK